MGFACLKMLVLLRGMQELQRLFLGTNFYGAFYFVFAEAFNPDFHFAFLFLSEHADNCQANLPDSPVLVFQRWVISL